MNADSIVQSIFRFDLLTRIPRTGFLMRGVDAPETVGEHIYSAAILAVLIVPELRKAGIEVDGEKLVSMVLLHEAGEILLGDIPAPAAAFFGPGGKSAAERAAGKTLLCCAEPISDMEIEYIPQTGAQSLPVQLHVARVTRLEPLSADVMRVMLTPLDGSVLKFYAGQYINIVLDNGEKRSFSFASAPHAAQEIELQVRLVPGGKFTTMVFEQMKVGDTLQFEGPLGTFTLRQDSEKPIVFVAGSTGFAPVKSMVESAFHTGMDRRMILYWGVRRRSDLYLGSLAEQWAREHANFEFVPVLSDPQPEDAWTGRTGLVHEAILADFPDLSQHQVYACGSVQMVQAAQPAFVKHGISSDDCFSDAFHLAPQRPIDSQHADVVKLGGNHV